MNEKRKAFFLQGRSSISKVTKSYLLKQGFTQTEILEMVESSLLTEIEIPVCPNCIREIESEQLYSEQGCDFCGEDEEFFKLPYYKYNRENGEA